MDFRNSSKWEQVLESTVLNNVDSESAHAKLKILGYLTRFIFFFSLLFFSLKKIH